MVNIDTRLEAIQHMVEEETYIVIRRARQFGKTTTISLLKKKLSGCYTVFSISLEGLPIEAFAGETPFCQRICRLLYNSIYYQKLDYIPEAIQQEFVQMKSQDINLADLSDFISRLCSQLQKPAVLIIDEVDQAGNQEIFLSFLGMLRSKYLNREEEMTFHSVILAGIYNIKNLKLKKRPGREHRFNSPWNIAVDFQGQMSFSVDDIIKMLSGYEADNHTGMDIPHMASLLYEYTSGYPYFVSRLCKILDEMWLRRESSRDGILQETGLQENYLNTGYGWDKDGLLSAVRELLVESNPLFDDMVKKLEEFPELKRLLSAVLFQGEKIPYHPDNFAISVGNMFGFLNNEHKTVTVSNRIFEIRLYDWFLSEEILESKVYKAAQLNEGQFIHNGRLDMELVLERFAESFHDIYADTELTFIEENGRRFFLLFLKPIINGTGNYYIEAQTRTMRRTDIVVDYHGQQFICELKIWHGAEYHRKGLEQLAGFLDDYHLKKGYLISFNFNQKKDIGMRKFLVGGKEIVEVVI